MLMLQAMKKLFSFYEFSSLPFSSHSVGLEVFEEFFFALHSRSVNCSCFFMIWCLFYWMRCNENYFFEEFLLLECRKYGVKMIYSFFCKFKLRKGPGQVSRIYSRVYYIYCFSMARVPVPRAAWYFRQNNLWQKEVLFMLDVHKPKVNHISLKNLENWKMLHAQNDHNYK